MHTYFVDCELGLDTASGTSPQVPWKTLERVNRETFEPGDTILLRADRVFKGQLMPHGSGTAERPITIGMYGNGNRPLIEAGGTFGSEEDNYLAGAAVCLYNVDHWRVEDLEITNNSPFYRQQFIYCNEVAAGMERNKMVPSPENRYRYGVLVRWDNYGVGCDIVLSRLYIHDVLGEMQRFCSDGILVINTGMVDADPTVVPTRGKVPTHFEDVRIEDCTIDHIDRTGISVWTQWMERMGHGYRGNLFDTSNIYHMSVGEWQGSTGLVIRGCRILDTAGDAVLIGGCVGALIEKNYVAHTCREMRIGCNAAVWPQFCDNTVMQYNEVCYTHGVLDGQAFDVDFCCRDTYIQYNYTHDNEGGFLLLMNETYNNVIRYNVSRNDFNSIVWYHRKTPATFYNNTFIMSAEGALPNRSPYDDDECSFFNNVFLWRKPADFEWNAGPKYSHNAYCNVNIPADDAPCEVAPELLALAADPEALPLNFIPGAGSPLLTGGMEIPDNGGIDYLGRPVKPGLIGALESR